MGRAEAVQVWSYSYLTFHSLIRDSTGWGSIEGVLYAQIQTVVTCNMLGWAAFQSPLPWVQKIGKGILSRFLGNWEGPETNIQWERCAQTENGASGLQKWHEHDSSPLGHYVWAHGVSLNAYRYYAVACSYSSKLCPPKSIGILVLFASWSTNIPHPSLTKMNMATLPSTWQPIMDGLRWQISWFTKGQRLKQGMIWQ